MEDYKEIELYETKLRVYPNGDIWRLCKNTNQFGIFTKWCLVKVKVKSNGYFEIQIDNKMIKCHRILAYAYLGLDITDKTSQIDHINRIRNDNRIENLRIVNNSKNQFNKSNVKGYSIIGDKFQARIRTNGKIKWLGVYDTPEEASARYYEEKAISHII
jgi:hypothetical protein